MYTQEPKWKNKEIPQINFKWHNLHRGVFPLFVSIVNYGGGDCNFVMKNKGGLCI